MVFKPVDGFFFEGFELEGWEAAFGGKKKAAVIVTEVVADGRRVRHRESSFPWRERNDVHMEEGRGLLPPRRGEEFFPAQSFKGVL